MEPIFPAIILLRHIQDKKGGSPTKLVYIYIYMEKAN